MKLITPLQFHITQIYQSRLAYTASFLLLLLQRSPLLVHFDKIQKLLTRPIVHLAKITAPLAAYGGGMHAVTGATGVVPAGNSTAPAQATVGEEFTWVFRVTGETAHSYSVTGLPQGLAKSSQVLSGGISSFSGIPEEAGTFEVQIIGWRRANERGDATPPYTLELIVEGGEPPTIATQPQSQSVDAGSAAAFQVEAQGSGLTYRWLKDGQEITSTVRTWINDNTPMRAFVPTGPIDDTWRLAGDFDDSAWQTGNGGVGYERSSANTYDPFFGLDVETDAFQKNTSTLVRVPFTLTEADLANANALTLRVRYDDGFVAFLNGTRVADANAPTNLSWDSAATAAHEDSLAVEQGEISLSEHLEHLRVGENMLAVQVMNETASSSDLLFDVELLGGRDTNAPTLAIAAATADDAGSYVVEVSNAAGSVSSEAATLEVSSSATPFEAWLGEHALNAAQTNEDLDGDGISNLEEYYLGTNPKQVDTRAALPATLEQTADGDRLTIRFPRTDAAGVLASFEHNASLTADAWAPLEHGADGVEIVEEANEVSVTFPVTDTQGFIRRVYTVQNP